MRNLEDQELDSSWVLASQKGDSTAFNRLVLKWEKTVYNIAFRMLRNPEEAEEATQEAFLLAFKHIRRFRNDSKFSTWLYRIVINHCLTCVDHRPQSVHISLDDGDKTTNYINPTEISKYPPAKPEALRLLVPQRDLIATDEIAF
jgi:RNA polymerase sigma-70 factor, ECF subfamily